MPITERLVWLIETRLHEALTLDSLAELCGASPWHMGRVFRLQCGMSPMAYLRARRLATAAKALARSDESILSVALGIGYNSHEAFTRAFSEEFGLPPSSVRSEAALLNLTLVEPIDMSTDMTNDLSPPDLRDHPGLRVAGLALNCSVSSLGGISGLWAAFAPRMAEIGDGGGYSSSPSSP